MRSSLAWVRVGTRYAHTDAGTPGFAFFCKHGSPFMNTCHRFRTRVQLPSKSVRVRASICEQVRASETRGHANRMLRSGAAPA
eukprot:9056554-Pyramimonas_sp.AAC.1